MYARTVNGALEKAGLASPASTTAAQDLQNMPAAATTQAMPATQPQITQAIQADPSQTAQAWFDEYATGFTPKDTGLQFWTNRINEVGSEAALNEFLNPSWKEGSDQTRHSTMYQDPEYLAATGQPTQTPPATVSPDYGRLSEPYIPGYSPPRPGIEAPPVYTYAQPQSPGYAPVDIPLSYAQQQPSQTVPTSTVTSDPTTGTPTYNIGSFTPGAVQSTTPRLNTNIAYNVGPSLSQMYADQLARETGARGLREDEIQALVRSGIESIGRPVGSELGPSAEELAFQERQLRSGAVSPADFGGALQKSIVDEGAKYLPKTVEGLYQTYLGREPDPEGLANWQQQFGETVEPDEVQRFIEAAKDELGDRYSTDLLYKALPDLPESLRASYDYYNRMGTWGQSGLPTYGPSPSRASFIRGMGQDELGETVLTDTLTGRNVLPSGTVSPDGTTTASGATMFTTVPMSANDLYSSFFDNPNSFLTGQSNALSPYVTRTTNPQYDDENAWDMQQRGITPYNYSMSKDQYDKAVEAGVINPNEYKYDEVGKQILRVAKFAQGGPVNSNPTMAFINRQDPAAQRAGVTPKQVQKAQDFLAFAQSKRFGI